MLTVLVLWSCTRDSTTTTSHVGGATSDNRPPVVHSVTFLHNPIQLKGPVAVQVLADDPEREAVSLQYQWYVDDLPLAGQTNPLLPAELLRRGQMVSVEIVPVDSTQKGKPFRSSAIAVGNTPPQVTSVTLAPLTAQPGERVEALAEASDPDHDRTDLTYRWFRNTTTVKEGTESYLDTTGFVPRDQIAVEVTPYDPQESGGSLRSIPLILGNRVPKIVSVPPASTTGSQYEYRVNAVDPDGDRITYQLESAPPGMMINEQSGHLAWPIPSNQTGTFHVKVLAKDEQGAAAFQEFDLTLATPSSQSAVGVKS
ncbi:putative Ig domain-containing protein [Nitrospira moscoviensis]|uniref:Dystroglycan-type cadherin-like domain-containing protein n=1 Tax=Nitrospira moscoviensis TaxID=42253 RepID=A0A0K2GIN1_NITMO|nr:putative Ig domain-containing protein [Nitrospira moscoviensis]ALA60818.1 hypothetical protein NITMOv2_4444 [Nitrospira moscoviensis]